MGMVLQGVELDDDQMAAIVPVINQYAQKSRMTTKDKLQMEQDCLEAMKAAGCALVQSLGQ